MRAVLTYHSIDDSGSVVSMPESVFRSHVEWLTSGVVRVVHLEELVQMDDDSVDAVAITFDDGLESFQAIAAPLLLEAKLPATVFVVPSLVGKSGHWRGGLGEVPAFPLMDWPTLRSLGETPSVRLGAHTLTHPVLPCLDDVELEAEVVRSADEIQRKVGRRPTSFAYPYGALDDRAVRVASATFDVCVTTRFDLVPRVPDLARVPRLDMWYFQRVGAFDSWGSAQFRLRIGLRRRARAVSSILRRSSCE